MEISTVFKWKIENFSTVATRDDPNKIINGPTFELQNGSIFYLRFYPTNIHSFESMDYCSLYLVPKDLAGSKSVALEYRLWIENINGKKLGLRIEEITYEFKKNEEGCGYGEFVRHNQLYSPADFVENDIVFICCEAQNVKPVQKAVKKTVKKAVKKAVPSSYDSVLREKLYSFYKEDSVDKCVLKVQDKEFKISKPILIAHSEVFERIFSIGMNESNTNVVTINDIRPEAMEAFIDYLYLQRIDNPDALAEELFFVADKYSVNNLKKECVESMSKTFSKKNALKRLKLAFMHKNDDLKKHALSYVCKKESDGNFRSILKSEEWKNLFNEEEQLATEIMDAVFDQIKVL